ncbi:PEP/pyruvate-binding domain-containing protein [Nonomuraea sp. NPDC051191]|uniref:PEP/pyruvate-binding domain-containing protein n=1 Tax=Nonomuraea sp. NPDC051191 TaxID=3364372 RepID=UPI0037919396
MIVPLKEAVADTCGGKGGALGALIRAGLPVPGGFVLPFAAYLAAVGDLDLARHAAGPDGLAAARQAIEGRPVPAGVVAALADGLRALGGLGDPPVAVRSSAADEDTGLTSAAGMYESFLAVRGVAGVTEAVRACWASLFSPRAAVGDRSGGDPMMAVVVQRHLDAAVSGVMFTPGGPDEPTRIEASWGLGPSVVGGTVTPDSYRVAGDGSVERAVADKRTRLDREGARLVVRDVPTGVRGRAAIDDATAVRLAGLGAEIAALRGGPQDVEWAVADGRVWILQARPVTAAPPLADPLTRAADGPAGALVGTPGSRGAVTGIARIVRGPADFARVLPGDVLVCPFTDPAWTPLLRMAAGVVTETGGVLSHAAIVAREHAIPAVLGVPDATGRLLDGTLVTVDGTAGTVTAA